jgi:hypothetical protein
MDYRSFEWLQLLPSGTDFVVEGAPDTFRELLPAPMSPSARGYIGWQASRSTLPDLNRYESVVLIKPRGSLASVLAGAGFRHTVTLAAIPSLSKTHWLLPLAQPRTATVGVNELVTPKRFHHRLKKDVLLWMARAGQLHRIGDTIVLGRRTRSDLEVGLEELLSAAPLVLALKTGPPGVMRKITVQAMTADGVVRGYAKLATSDDARIVVEREVRCLTELATCAPLRDSVPQLLGTIELPGALAAVLAPGPSRRGPTQFGEPHRRFLRSMAAATGRHLRLVDSEMWRDLQEKRRALEPMLVFPWRDRIATAMSQVEASLGFRELPLAMAHRDFGPWNTRQRHDGSLFVFDWDNARSEMIPLYDLFTFHFLNYDRIVRQTSAPAVVAEIVAIGRRWWPELDADTIRDLFFAYLTEVALSSLRSAMRVAGLNSSAVLRSVATLLDQRSAWLPSSPRMTG